MGWVWCGADESGNPQRYVAIQRSLPPANKCSEVWPPAVLISTGLGARFEPPKNHKNKYTTSNMFPKPSQMKQIHPRSPKTGLDTKITAIPTSVEIKIFQPHLTVCNADRHMVPRK